MPAGKKKCKSPKLKENEDVMRGDVVKTRKPDCEILSQNLCAVQRWHSPTCRIESDFLFQNQFFLKKKIPEVTENNRGGNREKQAGRINRKPEQ